MGWVFNTKEESADIRGIPDESLPDQTDTQIILIALARLYESMGLDDNVLINEMYRRGREAQRTLTERKPGRSHSL